MYYMLRNMYYVFINYLSYVCVCVYTLYKHIETNFIQGSVPRDLGSSLVAEQPAQMPYSRPAVTPSTAPASHKVCAQLESTVAWASSANFRAWRDRDRTYRRKSPSSVVGNISWPIVATVAWALLGTACCLWSVLNRQSSGASKYVGLGFLVCPQCACAPAPASGNKS